MALDELVNRSSLPRYVCETFVRELQQAGLLLRSPSVQAVPRQDGVHAEGSRSDRNLGDAEFAHPQTRELARTYDTHSPRTPGTALAQPSLLARIRRRLGIWA